MASDQAKEAAPERKITRIVVEMEGGALRVGGDIQDVVVAGGMLTQAIHCIQKQQDEQIERMAAILSRTALPAAGHS